MPRKQSTAVQRARQRQAATGAKYTSGLRTETGPRSGPVVVHAMFSADGAGWAPIIQRADRELRELRPGRPKASWAEKFGDLLWHHVSVDESREVWAVSYRAAREAAATCQTGPSPGRKRVVWVGGDRGGMPWVRTCCDTCYHVPPRERSDREYLWLVERYEERA
ncbi:hypothetical protein [Streptomyces cacaoi]|uniref:hypothetical protein n=1 Tax=Streptomyces cacaoi TaxID=1898 RepID=UPI003749F264